MRSNLERKYDKIPPALNALDTHYEIVIHEAASSLLTKKENIIPKSSTFKKLDKALFSSTGVFRDDSYTMYIFRTVLRIGLEAFTFQAGFILFDILDGWWAYFVALAPASIIAITTLWARIVKNAEKKADNQQSAANNNGILPNEEKNLFEKATQWSLRIAVINFILTGILACFALARVLAFSDNIAYLDFLISATFLLGSFMGFCNYRVSAGFQRSVTKDAVKFRDEFLEQISKTTSFAKIAELVFLILFVMLSANLLLYVGFYFNMSHSFKLAGHLIANATKPHILFQQTYAPGKITRYSINTLSIFFTGNFIFNMFIPTNYSIYQFWQAMFHPETDQKNHSRQQIFSSVGRIVAATIFFLLNNVTFFTQCLDIYIEHFTTHIKNITDFSTKDILQLGIPLGFASIWAAFYMIGYNKNAFHAKPKTGEAIVAAPETEAKCKWYNPFSYFSKTSNALTINGRDEEKPLIPPSEKSKFNCCFST